jgi:5-methylcytosine-specific restriction endonuclease McrA
VATIGEACAAVAAEQAEREARRSRKPSRAVKRSFYASQAWRRLRYRALKANAERNGGVIRCEVCGRSKADGVKCFHVDHIVPLSVDWRRRLDPSNLQVFCDDENLGKGDADAIDWRPAA